MERKIRRAIVKYIVDMFGSKMDSNNVNYEDAYTEEFSEFGDNIIDFSKNNINENQLEGFIIYELDSILTEKDSREFAEKGLREFSKEIYKIVKGENSMKKVSKWEDLMKGKISNRLGLIAKVENPNCDAPICNIYTAEDENDPVAVIDWMSGNTPEETVNMLRKFGFDVEYEEKFNLAEFLKASLEPKEFNSDEMNFYFAFTENNYIGIFNEKYCRTLNCRYFSKKIDDISCVEETLSDKEVTIEQLKFAMKELGWI